MDVVSFPNDGIPKSNYRLVEIQGDVSDPSSKRTRFRPNKLKARAESFKADSLPPSLKKQLKTYLKQVYEWILKQKNPSDHRLDEVQTA